MAKGKRTCEGVEFKPAEGGLVSETRYKTARGGSGGGPSYDYDHETAVHPTMEDAHSHLETHLGHVFSGKKEASTRTGSEETAGSDTKA